MNVNQAKGDVSTNAESSTGLGRKIEAAVKSVMVNEMRPGGLLARADHGDLHLHAGLGRDPRTHLPRPLRAVRGRLQPGRPDGLNPILPTWKLNFTKRTQAEAQAIYSWLVAQNAHYTPASDWAAPGEGVAAGELFGTGTGRA